MSSAEEPSGPFNYLEPEDKRFCEQALQQGFCTREQIQDAYSTKATVRAVGIEEPLSAILVKKGLLSEARAKEIQRRLNPHPIIGGYKLLSKVGQGGMGMVFRAKQLSMDREVALKILSRKFADNPSLKKRFLREAHLGAKLSHPNLIDAIDCGEDGGYTYFAMEFIGGKTVKRIVHEQGPLGLDRSLDILRQVANAVSYAHQQLLLHRDIKPDNIMITDKGIAKLCDLGLARLMDTGDDPGLTQAGRALGTPHYLSPEQARGRKDIDRRTDIYSLGATLYFMLSGRTLFDGESSNNVIFKHVSDTAPALNTVASGIPAVYGMIVSKMLAKRPEHRYASIADVLADLDRAAAGARPVAAGFEAASSCMMPSHQSTPMHPPTARKTTGPRPAVRVAKARARGRTDTAARGGNRKQQEVPVMVWAGVGLAIAIMIAAIAAGTGSGNRTQAGRGDSQSGATSVARNRRNQPRIERPTRKAQTPGAEGSNRASSQEQKTPTAVPRTPLVTNPDPRRESGKTPGPARVDPRHGLAKPGTGLPPVPTKRPVPIATSRNPARPARPVQKDGNIEKTPPKAAPANANETIASKRGEGNGASPETGARDDAHSAFLRLMLAETRAKPLRTALERLRKAAKEAVYEPARARVASDLGLVEAAIRFEDEALEQMTKTKPEIALPENMRGPQLTRGRVTAYDPGKGATLTVKTDGGNISLTVPAWKMPMTALLNVHPKRDDRGLVAGYLLIRGDLDAARSRLTGTADPALDGLSARLDLITGHKPAQEPPGKETPALADASAAEKDNRVGKETLSVPSPPSPMFNAAHVNRLPNGYVELRYDFSARDAQSQLADFACGAGRLHLADGSLKLEYKRPKKKPGKRRGKGPRPIPIIYLRVPLSSVKKLEVRAIWPGRPSHNTWVGLSPYPVKNLGLIRSCQYTYRHESASLDRWGDPARPAVGSLKQAEPYRVVKQIKVDSKRPLVFGAEAVGSIFRWTLNEEKVGTGLLTGPNQRHVVVLGGTWQTQGWRALRVIGRPDPQWVRAKLEASRTSRPGRL